MALGLGGFGSAVSIAADTLGLGGLLGSPNAIPGSSLEIDVEGLGQVVLRGRAMPFAEVAFPTEMRLKKTLYPGNPNASIQLLNYDSLPTEISGEWNARFLRDAVTVNGDPKAIQTPAQLCQLFESIVRGGRPVRVQWLHIVRAGYLRKFEPVWLRYTDVKWVMTFEWMAADDLKAEAPRGLPKAGFGVTDLLKTLKKIEDVIALGPMLARSLSATLVSGVVSIRKHIGKLMQVFAAIDALVNMPAALWGAIKAAISSIRDECLELSRRITGWGRLSSATTPELAASAGPPLMRDPLYPSGATSSGNGAATSSGDPSPIAVAHASSTGAQIALLQGFLRSISTALMELAHQAVMMGIELDVQVRPEASRAVVVRQGDTLGRIAAREYGSEEYATYLMQANGLQTSIPPAGFRLKVPARPYGALPEVEIVGTEVVEITGGCQGCIG